MALEERCSPHCEAEVPLTDTADGREHDACPDPELACAEYLIDIQQRKAQVDDEWRLASAWMLRHLLSVDKKSVEFGDYVIRVRRKAVACADCERRKREATQFWHPGADSAFPYIVVEKKVA